MRSAFEVYVANVGLVYRGASHDEASALFRIFADLSQRGVGRAAHEDVILVRNGVVILHAEPGVDTSKLNGCGPCAMSSSALAGHAVRPSA